MGMDTLTLQMRKQRGMPFTRTDAMAVMTEIHLMPLLTLVITCPTVPSNSQVQRIRTKQNRDDAVEIQRNS